MARTTCRSCGGTEIYYDTGTGVCTKCGNVVEESQIVSDVTFGEASNGAAIAHGKNVPVGGDRSESRAQVIANGKAKIREVATSMKLGPYTEEMARRHFNMCVAVNFIKGRSSIRVAAACLYISCRQQKTSHMLIDFSDKLRINVFELGTTYTKLVRELHLEKDLPLVDPAHYVGRFAAMLEFGSETQKVATDAARLVKRFDSDWLRVGRRPSGICGACLLLAARMNNFRRSIEEIVQVVKISDSTIRKRLEEFKETPSGNLTVEDFRSLWLEEYVDPPAFTRGKEKRLREEEVTEAREGDEDDPDADDEEDSRPRKRARQGSVGPVVESLYALAKDRLAVDENGDERSSPPLPADASDEVDGRGGEDLQSDNPLSNNLDPETSASGALEDDADFAIIAEEVENHLKAGQDIAEEYAREVGNGEIPSTLESSDDRDKGKGTQSGNETTGAGDQPQPPVDTPATATEDVAGDVEVDDFEDIDDDEMSKYICTSEEVTRKTRLWVEFNLQYLENLAAKGLDEQSGVEPKKKRSKPAKPKDSSTPAGSTPEEASRKLFEKKRMISKRINYDRVSALLSTKVPAKKKKSKDGRQKSSSRTAGRDDADDDIFGSDGDKLQGLERMSEHGSDYSNGRGSAPADDFGGGDDGYDSDSYQQEA